MRTLKLFVVCVALFLTMVSTALASDNSLEAARKGMSLRELSRIYGTYGVWDYFRTHSYLNTPTERLVTMKRAMDGTYMSRYKKAYGRPKLTSVYRADGVHGLKKYRAVFGETPTASQMYNIRAYGGQKLGLRGLSLHRRIFHPHSGEFSTKRACDRYWRPYVMVIYRANRVGTRHNVHHCLNTIYGESRGNPYAKNRSSSATGLLQFLDCWTHSRSKRFNPMWSINRQARAVREGGHGTWSHWSATMGSCY